MNCTFCNRLLEDRNGLGYFSCQHDSVRVSFLCSGNSTIYEIWYTSFLISDEKDIWEISLSHRDSTCNISRSYVDTIKFTDSIMKLNFLPHNMTPENARQKLKTLLTFS